MNDKHIIIRNKNGDIVANITPVQFPEFQKRYCGIIGIITPPNKDDCILVETVSDFDSLQMGTHDAVIVQKCPHSHKVDLWKCI